MKRFIPLAAATALVLCSGAIAQTEEDGAQSPGQAQAAPGTPNGSEAKPGGFVVLQRNIYVPIDSEGKVASSQWVVIEKQGFVTTDEFETMAREAQADQANKGGKGDEDSAGQGQEGAPAAEEPAAPSPHATPSVKGHPLPMGQGPIINS
ncbi:MAG TPA: hypothetical protein VFJ62_09955 [Usitatibacter sp.]|nr:hypothetical protein [Usitatibacter sp.]